MHIKYFSLSRFAEIWYPHPAMAGLRRLLHTWLRPFVDAFWSLAERVIGGQLGLLTPELRPDVPFRKAAPCLTLTLDNLKSIHDGCIALHRGAVARFTADGLELDNGKVIGAQIVILATGYRQDVPFLSETEKAALFDRTGAILLYRYLINPDIPFTGFNGYNGGGSCQLAAEVGASWLVQFMMGRMITPERAVMHRSIREEIELRREVLWTGHGVGYYTTPTTMDYLDQLLADLGLPPADRHRRLFGWLFTPLDPRDYQNLLTRGEEASARQPSPDYSVSRR
jgi:hypothetical protein